MTTIKKIVIIQLLLGVTYCSKRKLDTLVGNPTMSDLGQCATAYQVGNLSDDTPMSILATFVGNLRKFNLMHACT